MKTLPWTEFKHRTIIAVTELLECGEAEEQISKRKTAARAELIFLLGYSADNFATALNRPTALCEGCGKRKEWPSADCYSCTKTKEEEDIRARVRAEIEASKNTTPLDTTSLGNAPGGVEVEGVQS